MSMLGQKPRHTNKIMREVVRLRAMDRVLSEQDALLDTYRDALGLR